MKLHISSGFPRPAMMATSWIWSEVDAVVVNAELFPDLAAAVVLGDDNGLGSDLGLAGLNLGSSVFYY
jgi:hypothetical protein